MRRELAESFAADIETNELLQCSERLHRLKMLAAASEGEECKTFQHQVEAAEAELKQWSDLVSLVKACANLDGKTVDGVINTVRAAAS